MNISRKTGIIAAALLAASGAAYGLPDKPVVTSGQASFNSSPGSLTITNSPGTIINWQGFSIGAGEQTRFNQQSSSSAVLNRVVGADPSSILGSLTSNGRVYLINPHGIIFGRGATIDTSGFIASTLNISDRDFLEGRLRFEGGGDGVLRNEGAIRANSDIYLVGPRIENTGLVRSESGSVLLAAGQSVTISGPDAQGVQFALQAPKDAALNLGTIEAKNAAAMFAGTLRHSGETSANRVTLSATGKAVLEAGSTVAASGDGANVLVWSDGTARVHGMISAKDAGGKGGFVETSARTLDLNCIRVDTGGGEWLIDPNDFTIASSGGNITGTTLSANLGSGNVTIQSSGGGVGGGDINLNDAVSWSANLLTLTAARDININAVMTASGTSRLTMNTATANGADGAVAGGTVKVGMNAAGFTGRVDFPGRGGVGILTINGDDYTIIQTIGAEGSVSQEDLQGMNGRLNWNYALGGNIDASGTSGWNAGAGFAPVGDNATPFTGRFNGLGHTVSGLSISRAGTNYVGLFGTSYGDVRNVCISGGSIGGNGYVGALVGDNNGTVTNSYATASVTGANDMVGGLTGRSGSVVANSFATGNVNGNDSVGGLVGFNTGTISNSYSTSNVDGANRHIGGLVGFNAFGATTTDSHASGAVTAGNIGQRYIGGLAGQNDGTITNSYSTAEVQAYSYAGGLVGYNDGSISGCYSDAIVTASDQFAGGLAGYNDVGANINTSYNTGYVRAYEYSGGLAGWNDGSITVSYNTGPVNGAGAGSMNIGGLVGYSAGTIVNAYNTGNVTGGQRIGGLAGALDGAGSITNSYNAGTVTGSSFTGGLVGRYWAGTVTDSYWDTTASGQAASTGGGTGLSTASMKQQASFTGLDFTTIWRIYEGNTYPLLKSFLTPLTVTANSGSRVYDGTANSALGVSYSTTPNANLLGTATVTADSQNVGNRTLTAGGHYSNQQGYDITYANGALTVNPAPLTVTANNATRTYDGVAYSGGNGVTYGGFVNGETSAVLGGALNYGGSSQGAVNAGNYAITPSGLTSSNYAISYSDGTLTINPAPSASSGTPGSPSPGLYRDEYSMITSDRITVLDTTLRNFFHPAIADGAPEDKTQQGVQVCR